MNKKRIFENIINGVTATVARFPIPVLISIVGTIISLMLIHNNHTDSISKLFYTIALAFPLSIAATLVGERNGKKSLYFGILGIFLLIYYFFIGKNLFTVDIQKYRIQYILWILASIALVTFIPFIKKIVTEVLGFWHFNQRILYSILATGFYSGAIYAGLSIALFAVNTLFDLHIKSIRWEELLVLVLGLFSTTFFLARFPRSEENETDYPKELRIFTFYVLMPLVAIYFLILYSYTGKIILSHEWPKGVISSMVLGFSMLGIFTYALAYPLTIKDGILQKISKWFFIALLPQTVVLFLAVKVRIAQYAITEQRYFVVIFGFWLVAMSLYFLFDKKKNIEIVAITLFLLLFAVSWGPWGAFEVSRDSQVKRLERILIKDNMLVNGKVQPAATSTAIAIEDRREISNIIYYLNQNHGLDSIQPWFTEDLSSTTEYYSRPKHVTELLGIYYIDVYQNDNNIYFTTSEGKYGQNIKVTGYDYLVNNTNELKIGNDAYKFEVATSTFEYVVYKNNSVLARASFKNFYDNLVAEYKKTGKTQFSPEELTFTYTDATIQLLMYISSINSSDNNLWIDGTTLVKFK